MSDNDPFSSLTRAALIDGGIGYDILMGSVAKDALLGGDGADMLWRPRVVQESRRWRHGDITAPAANQNLWRTAA